MRTTNPRPYNVFIFSERNLPGYMKRAKLIAGRQINSLPFSQVAPRSQFENRGRFSNSVIDKGRKWQRKAVPSTIVLCSLIVTTSNQILRTEKTAIIGKISREINCLPVENEDYLIYKDILAKEAKNSRKETMFLTGNVGSLGGNVLAPGTYGALGNFGTFIVRLILHNMSYVNGDQKTTGLPRGSRPQESKAARMPQNELMDLIYDCFKEYTYWSLKSIRARTNQPENYLKQTLEKVAQLVRQGPYALMWQLRPESNASSYIGDDVVAEASCGLDDPYEVGDVSTTDRENETINKNTVGGYQKS